MSIPIMERGNDAVNINPPTANRSLLVKGSNWLWAATAVMGIAFLSWLFWTLLRYRSRTATSHANNNGDNGVHKSHVWLWIEDTYLKYFGENRTSYGVKDTLHKTEISGNKDVDEIQRSVGDTAGNLFATGHAGGTLGNAVDKGALRGDVATSFSNQAASSGLGLGQTL